MRIRIFVLFLIIAGALSGIADSGEKISFYIGCSPEQRCIDFTYADGKKESVLATPVQELTKSDIQSAIVQSSGNKLPSLSIELNKEAAGKLQKTTREHIGKKLVVVLNDKILAAPTINAPITGREIVINGKEGHFWEETPWLREKIKSSYRVSGRRGMVYIVIAAAILIAATIFVLTPRIRRRRHPISE